MEMNEREVGVAGARLHPELRRRVMRGEREACPLALLFLDIWAEQTDRAAQLGPGLLLPGLLERR
jgi:hypothetical protein